MNDPHWAGHFRLESGLNGRLKVAMFYPAVKVCLSGAILTNRQCRLAVECFSCSQSATKL